MSTNEKRTMDRRRFLKAVGVAAGALAAGGLGSACGGAAPAQPTAAPTKPAAAAPTAVPTKAAEAPAWLPKSEVTFIVPYAPGGATDPISRTLAAEAEPLLKQKVVVVNKEGSAGVIGTAEVVQAKTDGYKIGLSSANAAVFQALVGKLPYKGPADYQPIIKVAEVPATAAVLPNAPWKDFKEFMEDAKKRPEQISIGSSGRFSSSDLPFHELMLKTGVKFNMVPFSGGGEALTAALGGHVDAMVSTPLNIAPQVKAGKLRALTLFQKGRNSLFPDTPSTVESGYDVTHPIEYFVIGPRGMDKGALDSYYKVFLEVIKGPKFQQFAKDNGFVLDPIGPAELAKELDQWNATYEMLIRELKIEVKR